MEMGGRREGGGGSEHWVWEEEPIYGLQPSSSGSATASGELIILALGEQQLMCNISELYQHVGDYGGLATMEV